MCAGYARDEREGEGDGRYVLALKLLWQLFMHSGDQNENGPYSLCSF